MSKKSDTAAEEAAVDVTRPEVTSANDNTEAGQDAVESNLGREHTEEDIESPPTTSESVVDDNAEATSVDSGEDAGEDTAQPVAVTTPSPPFNINKPRVIKRTQFPHTHQTTNDQYRLPPTIANLEYMLNYYGITVRYDVIGKQIRINIPGMTSSPDNADNAAITQIVSLAALNGLPTGRVPAYLEAIGDKHQTNMVMDYIQRKPWDKVRRIDKLAATLQTPPDFPEKLKNTLVRKWLISAVAAAALPSGFRSRGVLCLQGPQSIGKTSWILSLVDDPLVRSHAIKIDHHLDPSNKDSVLTAIRHLIVEVGEVDSSFRKDIARLKGFITANEDKIRRPYGHKDSVYPRRTVFIATVNHANFLVDDTGNSRWWTIPVTEIDFNHGIDMQQLWAQVYQLYEDSHEWWLTPEEEAELELQNTKHRAVSSIRDLVLSSLDLSIPDRDRVTMSASEVLRHLEIHNPTNAQCRDCGGVLREVLGAPKASQGLNRWLVPLRRSGDVTEIY